VELDPTLQVKEGTSQVTHRPLYEEEEGERGYGGLGPQMGGADLY
jgi:hypothetical protein